MTQVAVISDSPGQCRGLVRDATAIQCRGLGGEGASIRSSRTLQGAARSGGGGWCVGTRDGRRVGYVSPLPRRHIGRVRSFQASEALIGTLPELRTISARALPLYIRSWAFDRRWLVHPLGAELLEERSPPGGNVGLGAIHCAILP
ncbi:MAG: hypothetical protein NVSMB12_10460 [Acidimicrobiales bacterium]